MRNHFYRGLLFCAPLFVTGCSDISGPEILDARIATTAISPTSVSLSWNKATDNESPAAALVYNVYLSGPNPAYQSFDTIEEVEAGTFAQALTDAGSATISTGIAAGNAYYINIVVLDEKGNKALYEPLGEYFHANQISYYPFNGNGSDATATANHLVVATGLALPVITSDRFNHASSAYNFTPTTPQCLQSTADVGITTSDSRSVSLWVQSSNPASSVRRAAFAWGNDSGNGTSFGFNENGLGSVWNVWLGTATAATPTVVTSGWEHWVIVSTGGGVSAYKDGNAVGVTMNTATVNTLNSPLYVGCGIVSAAPGYPYQGNIDDVRIFNQPLNAADVANLYAVTH